MKNFDFMTLQERISFYQGEIDRRTPPATKHDQYMRGVYEKLLNHAMAILEMDYQESGLKERSSRA